MRINRAFGRNIIRIGMDEYAVEPRLRVHLRARSG